MVVGSAANFLLHATLFFSPIIKLYYPDKIGGGCESSTQS
jgi:hypothetical protein